MFRNTKNFSHKNYHGLKTAPAYPLKNVKYCNDEWYEIITLQSCVTCTE